MTRERERRNVGNSKMVRGDIAAHCFNGEHEVKGHQFKQEVKTVGTKGREIVVQGKYIMEKKQT